MVRLVGLTGTIASGKSAVSARLVAAGYPLVDADKVAHELLAEPGGDVHRRIVEEFGAGVLDERGIISREKLGAIVFNDHGRLRALNGITHQPISRRILGQLVSFSARGHALIVVDVPLLVKFPLLRRLFLASVIVVVVPPDVQLARLMQRDNITEEEARRKISSQAKSEELCRIADIVIENSGSLQDLDGKVQQMMTQLPRGWSIYTVALAAAAVTGVAAVAAAGAVKAGIVASGAAVGIAIIAGSAGLLALCLR